MNIIQFFIYSFCAFVPLVAIWAVFMVWSGRWEIEIEDDFDYENIPAFLQKQAD